MTLSSMTGFSTAAGELEGYSWSWEMRSVNSRSLDVRLRLPPGFDQLESKARAALSENFARGNISVNLQLKNPDRQPVYSVNEQALEALMTATSGVAGRLGMQPPGTDALLGLRGIIEQAEEEQSEEQAAALEAALTQSLNEAVFAMSANRKEEGARLHAVMTGLIDEIDGLVGNVVSSAEAQPAAIRDRLSAKIDELLEGDNKLSPERLAQEVTLLTVKADIREETDRLNSHIAAARELLASDEPVGRKLDFLCQEFNREANTICSKAATIEVTEIGLQLKTAIDRVREQVQNIE